MLTLLLQLPLLACDKGEEALSTQPSDSAETDLSQDSAPHDSPAQPQRDSAHRDSSSPDAEQAWEALRQAMEASELEDAILLIGDAESVRFQHALGERTEEDLLLLASGTKWLSAIVLLRMVDQELLSLDGSPQEHLSWWTQDPKDPRSQVTLRQLLSFTSGLAGDSGLRPGEESVPCIEEGETLLEDCAREIYEGLFRYEPGSTFHYGPAHLQVAGAMAAARTGQTFTALFREHLGEPLGLRRSSTVALPSTDNPRVAGGGTASAADYAQVMMALVSGELLEEESLQELIRVHTGEGVVMEVVPETASDGRSWRYALGSWRQCHLPSWDASCEESVVLSSPGAYGFYPWWDRSRGFWGVLALQSADPRAAEESVSLGLSWAELAAEAMALGG